MKVVVLCENTPCSETFFFEHGLSLYIETEKRKILFDTGQSDVFWKNADLLGIDLSQVDIAVLSHGHYDHGGGIESFLQMNTKAKVYLSQNAFGEHYNGTEKYIGLPQQLKQNERLIFCGDYLKIEEGLELFSQNEGELITPIDSAGLKVKRESEFLPDLFEHEQYLKITENGKTYLISGCSHKGILNITNWFQPDVLIGGFHLMKQEGGRENPVILYTAEELNKYSTVYYTCHCTGLEQYTVLKELMKDKLHYISSGQSMDI